MSIDNAVSISSQPVRDIQIAPAPSVRQKVRILSLDAGGSKCISSLLILETILECIPVQARRPGNLLKPCDFFDLICGSGWGAVAAIMLGRLEMTVRDCLRFMERAGTTSRWFECLMPSSKKARLKRLIQDELHQRHLDRDTPFYGHGACNTVIILTDLHAPTITVRFRSYDTKYNGSAALQDIPIWQIAVAAITNPLEMYPTEIVHNGYQSKYIAASMVGFSNPSREALDEAAKYWSPEIDKDLVSLGSGRKPRPSSPTLISSSFLFVTQLATVRLLRQVTSDSERVSEELDREAKSFNLNHTRLAVTNNEHFSALQGSNWSKSSQSIIGQAAKAYLERESIACKVKGCANSLALMPCWKMRLIVTKAPISQSSLNGPATSHVRWDAVPGRKQMPQREIAELEGVLFDTPRNPQKSSDARDADTWIQELRRHLSAVLKDPVEEGFVPIKIAVLDTGVDSSHSIFSPTENQLGGLKGFRDFTGGSSEAYDSHGHGTHTAGIIQTLAPHAECYVARVFEHSTFEESKVEILIDRIVKAMEYATHTWKVDIISMSFGFDESSVKLEEAILEARRCGIIILAAASNRGNRPANPIAYPARIIGHVIDVHSSDAMGNKSYFNPQAIDTQFCFSILGENVRSAWPNHSSGDDIEEDYGKWRRCSGTSVATPILASIVAGFIEFARRYPGMLGGARRVETLEGIQQILLEMSEKDAGFRKLVPAKFFSPRFEENISRVVATRIDEAVNRC